MEMKRNPLAGAGKVFSFTLKQLLCKKSWFITTVLIAVLLAAGIPLLLLAIASADSEDEEDPDKPTVKTVFVADETEGEADYNLLKAIDYQDVNYTAFDTADAAVAAVSDPDSTLVLRIIKSDGTYLITAILPDETALTRSVASNFADFVSASFKQILMEKAKLSPEAAAMLSVQISSSVSQLKADSDKPADDDPDGLKSMFQVLIPFMMVMLMYMMVILYGQSMANSVMLEKTSKLMETILTSVHPVALMTGKLFATATAAVLQILVWLGSLLFGIFGGAFFAMKMIPSTENTTVQTVDMVADISGSLFSLSGIILALVIIALSFLLYLCLGAVSGAMATKTEDLAKTNYVFMLVILASFFLCISFPSPETAENDISFVSSAAWLQYFPFTSVFVTPGRLILGELGLGAALGAIACMLIGVALLVWIAAVIYKALVLYRGTPPTPKGLLTMIRQNKHAKSAK